MQAAVFVDRGVELREIPAPEPADDEALIRVRAASINAPDWRIAYSSPLLRRLMMSAMKSKTLGPGSDVAGVVEAVGKNVTQFKAGDEVFGSGRGSFAEYVCSRELALVPKPASMTFEDAACVAASGITALQGLRDSGALKSGDRVLINGGSGAVGTFAVQIAKAFGAHVTAVCSPHNLDLLHSLGADRVIDYTKEDFTKESERYDVLFDNVGNHSLSSCRRVLTANGRMVLVGAPKKSWTLIKRLIASLVVCRIDKRVRMFLAKVRKEDLAALAALMQSGKVKPAIDRRYALKDVAEALQYVRAGHARAKVVITVS